MTDINVIVTPNPTFVTVSKVGIQGPPGIPGSQADSGLYYPASNPSGYITGVNLSAYVTTGMTGAFITSGQTGFLTLNNLSGVTNDALLIGNSTTGSTGIPNQYSPAINFSGNTIGSGNISKPMNWRIYESVSSGLVPTSQLNFDSSVTGGAYNNKLNIDNNGNAGLSGNLKINGQVTSNSGIFANNLTLSGSQVVTNNFYRAGLVSIDNLSTSQLVNFTSNLASTGYAVGLSFDATLGAAVSAAATAKTISGFTITLSAGIAGGATMDYTALMFN